MATDICGFRIALSNFQRAMAKLYYIYGFDLLLVLYIIYFAVDSITEFYTMFDAPILII